MMRKLQWNKRKGQLFVAAMKAMFWFVVLLLPQACIESYDADIEEEVKVVSVEGALIKGEPVQTVYVTRATALVNPQFIPVRECRVSLLDDEGHEYLYREEIDGSYTLDVSDEQLVFNRSYRLEVVTPGGEQYASAWETLSGGAEVDSVYYRIEEKFDNFSGEMLNGLQFYIDLEASDTVSRYFRWSLAETYEYTVEAPIDFYYEDTSLEPVIEENPMEFFRCWKTTELDGLYLSSTENLTINEKKMIPLHYVSTISDRLKIKYSLFVEQYTLSEGAYLYWQRNKIATQESGGLYTQQPGQPVSNVVNLNDSTEQVLGYFWVSHKTEQRIFVPRISSLPVIGEKCNLVEFNVVDHGEGPFPVYIYVDDQTGQNLTGTPYCFNCTLKGGTNVQPKFWK